MAQDGEYLDGEKHGDWISYFANGARMSEGTYNRGKKEGLWILYYPNGQKKSEATFVNDKYSGPYTAYHDNGQVFRQGRYNEYQGNSADGTKNGVWHQYASDGTLEHRTLYRRGSKVKSGENPNCGRS